MNPPIQLYLPSLIEWFIDFESGTDEAKARLLSGKARLLMAIARIDNQIAELEK
jgi:hypothetical protein